MRKCSLKRKNNKKCVLNLARKINRMKKCSPKLKKTFCNEEVFIDEKVEEHEEYGKVFMDDERDEFFEEHEVVFIDEEDEKNPELEMISATVSRKRKCANTNFRCRDEEDDGDDDGCEEADSYESDNDEDYSKNPEYDDNDGDSDYYENSHDDGDVDSKHSDLFEEDDGIVGCMVDSINEWGYSKHSSSKVGGKKSGKEIKTFVNRVSKFLFWAMFVCGLKISHEPTVQFIQTLCGLLITKKYLCISDYCQHLEDDKGFKASTLLGHLDTFKHFFNWVCFYSDRKETYNGMMGPIGDVIAKCRFDARKTLRKENSSRPTMKKKVELRHLPSDGFETLLKLVNLEIECIKNLRNFKKAGMTKQLYDRVIACIMAAFYCRLPQGRPGAFACLELEHMESFRTKGYAVTQFFKTNQTFGYQPILIDTDIYSILKIYVENFRPRAARAVLSSRGSCISSKYLLLTYEGDQHKKIGDSVQKFFIPFNFHIRATTLRALVATEARLAKQGGIITEAEHEAITNINGHSSQVTIDYYLLSNRSAETNSGRQGFSRMLGIPVHEPGETALAWPASDIPTPIEWGENHPDKNKTGRARWTDDEINIIGESVHQWKRDHPHNNRYMAQCLEHIRNTPAHHKIFHERHTLNSDRLKAGFTAYEKKYGDNEM